MTITRSGYMNEQGAADYTGLSVGWFRKHRQERTGPPFLKVGRRILYSVMALDQYLREFTVFTETITDDEPHIAAVAAPKERRRA